MTSEYKPAYTTKNTKAKQKEPSESGFFFLLLLFSSFSERSLKVLIPVDSLYPEEDIIENMGQWCSFKSCFLL